jgi:DUF438 domain-containing protein
MSEFINNSENRVKSLLQFSLGIINGENGTQLIEQHKDALENIIPYDMIEMEDRQIKMGITTETIKQHIEKIINVINPYLEQYNWEKPDEGHPIYYLMLENIEIEKILNKIKKTLKDQDFKKMTELTTKLSDTEKHYLRKENILFPYLEKIWDNYRPLSVMWSLHDDIRRIWKNLALQIKEDGKFTPGIYKTLGELFFLMYGMIFKENLIIYPIAMETVDEEHWHEMQKQSAELGYSYIEEPNMLMKSNVNKSKSGDALKDIFWKVETGELSKEQLELLLNHLPFDITFVDENDEVRYFSRPHDRFFPRSPAIVGRKVQNCHPPESVHIVEKIISEFKAGHKDVASFWIHMKGKFVLIRYYAMHDDAGKYRGILEVGQDITEIKKMDGEKRLLDWE